MRHFLGVISLLCFSLLVAGIYRYGNNNASAQTQIQPPDVTVSVGIGTPILQLYGYTSPFADVGLLAYPGITTRTFADKSGYFEFNGFFITSQTREICLEAIDKEKRATSPVCIPSPGINFTQGKIGPVILPPSISLENGSFLADATVAASGQSIPNSTITVSFFRGNPTLLSKITESIVPSVYAVSLPEYTVQTNTNGNYSFNLPSSTANKFRLFSQTSFNNAPSPKSNTLTFSVLTLFEWLIQQVLLYLRLLWELIKSLPIIETIIFLQLIILASLIYLQRQKHNKLMIIEKQLAKYNKKLTTISNYPAHLPSPPALR